MRVFSFYASIVSIIISLTALFMLANNVPISTGMDSSLVSVMSILVTVLVGWQIYTFIRIDEKMKGHEKMVEDKMLEVVADFNHVSIANELRMSSYQIVTQPDISMSTEYLTLALEEAMKTKFQNANSVIIQQILTDFRHAISSNKGKPFVLDDEKKRKYLRILYKYEGGPIDDIIAFVSNSVSNVEMTEGTNK